MGIVTTHTEGRVVTHSDDGQLPVEVVQLPARDGVDTSSTPEAPATSPVTDTAPAKASPAKKQAKAKKPAKAKTRR